MAIDSRNVEVEAGRDSRMGAMRPASFEVTHQAVRIVEAIAFRPMPVGNGPMIIRADPTVGTGRAETELGSRPRYAGRTVSP
jgi:hypothetical protein